MKKIKENKRTLKRGRGGEKHYKTDGTFVNNNCAIVCKTFCVHCLAWAANQ